MYSAPRLSHPCCLEEPAKRYTINDLPPVYWRQYNDAALLVERIKQRTPKLILHTAAAKCTLMANAAPGDVELLVGPGRFTSAAVASTSPMRSDPVDNPLDAPRIRLRLSRQCGSLEIARLISGARGEEWTKKVLKTNDELLHISTTDWETLERTEQDSIVHLASFWRICEALEDMEREDPATKYPFNSLSASKSRSRTLPVIDLLNTQPRPAPASFSSTQTMSLVNVAPRPSKLAFASTTTRKPSSFSSITDMASIEGQHLSVTGKTAIMPTWCREDLELSRTDDHRAPQTKFIPSVGWCMRHESRVSQGGRYKIMFFDGAVLEIDVDEDWAELTTQMGGKTRHNIRDCNSNRHMTERIKVFGEFVSMFDESE